MNDPFEHDQNKKPMTEKQKRAAGLPFNSAKLWQEMDDDGLDAIISGFSGDGQGHKHPDSSEHR